VRNNPKNEPPHLHRFYDPGRLKFRSRLILSAHPTRPLTVYLLHSSPGYPAAARVGRQPENLTDRTEARQEKSET
jgi:hypothetical protein